jgi:hypothetical protein
MDIMPGDVRFDPLVGGMVLATEVSVVKSDALSRLVFARKMEVAI